MEEDQPAGRELDARIARDVMLWQSCAPLRLGEDVLPLMHAPGDRAYQARLVPAFSTELAAAWQVVLRMRSIACGFRLCDVPTEGPEERWTATFGCWEYPEEVFAEASAATAPAAICLAALAAAAALRAHEASRAAGGAHRDPAIAAPV